MFRRTAVSSQMVPISAPVVLQRSARLALHLANRAVKCIGSPDRVSFRCPNDGSIVSIQNASSRASIQMVTPTVSNSRVAVAVDPNVDCDTTIVGIRNGIVFIRSNVRTAMTVDVQEDDVFAMLSSLAPPQVDSAVESLLCSLSRLTEVEQAAEEMLLEAKVSQGFAVLVAVGSKPSASAQPPERFP
ncbi:Hypothetical protein, putative [Bodo saltans]|uniref:Uncharacterized protein n=1 Tax=Bodo saltans TaxID=75058 RepID=A0A0S4JI60_BODSA|nr:Hypothetical protein, putative [Bodo saltans]|eukprot:CUG89987.1 Hypothetical protein, putative [Bodo saltans]